MKTKSLSLRDKLLASPTRAWDEKSTYDAIYIVPTRKKHDSGYMLMAIVGCLGARRFEIAAQCDDICWNVQTKPEYSMRTDCEYPSGILHYWNAKFHVGHALSSTDITVTDRKP